MIIDHTAGAFQQIATMVATNVWSWSGASEATVIVTDRIFKLKAAQSYIDGAVQGQTYLDGATEADTYIDGAIQAQAGC